MRLAALLLACALPLAAEAPPAWIDVHAHPDALVGPGEVDFEGAAKACVEEMDRRGIARTILMPMPFSPGHLAFDCGDFVDAIKPYADRLSFLGGGGTLNVMIQETAGDAQAATKLRRKFVEEARAILDRGACGFGEIAILHLSHFDGHPFEQVEGDHPLLLLLADFAAQNDVPIDIHMDPVEKDQQLPSKFASPPSPKTLAANVASFERLLAHNPKARIVWAHAGWDETGCLTVDLLRRLLRAHPNLCLSIKIDTTGLAAHSPLDEQGEVRKEWLALLRDFPDRFVIGSDQMHQSPSVHGRPRMHELDGPAALLAKLPADLARKIGRENAERIYRLGPR